MVQGLTATYQPDVILVELGIGAIPTSVPQLAMTTPTLTVTPNGGGALLKWTHSYGANAYCVYARNVSGGETTLARLPLPIGDDHWQAGALSDGQVVQYAVQARRSDTNVSGVPNAVQVTVHPKTPVQTTSTTSTSCAAARGSPRPGRRSAPPSATTCPGRRHRRPERAAVSQHHNGQLHHPDHSRPQVHHRSLGGQRIRRRDRLPHLDRNWATNSAFTALPYPVVGLTFDRGLIVDGATNHEFKIQPMNGSMTGPFSNTLRVHEETNRACGGTF